MEIIMEKALKIIMLERGLETIMVIQEAKNVKATCIHNTDHQIMERITTTTDYSHDLNLNGLMIVHPEQSYNCQHLFSNN